MVVVAAELKRDSVREVDFVRTDEERRSVVGLIDDLVVSQSNTCSPTVKAVADLPIPELVENQRRSIAMLAPGVPALNREQALELLGQLEAALLELRRLGGQDPHAS
jgi:hypothetical protein